MMVAMSERFEMRVDEDTLARVDKWRRKQRDVPSRAEAMRRLVERGLEKASGESVTFSDGEKLLIFMMDDLYKHLDISNMQVDSGLLTEMITDGHYWAPKWKFRSVFRDHESDPRVARYVITVLEMWDVVERGYAQLSKEERAPIKASATSCERPVRFMGFDSTSEPEEFEIAHFIIEMTGRFSRRFEGRKLDAGVPMRDTYAPMLVMFEPMRRRLAEGEVDESQIASVVLGSVGMRR
jgi:uncharacterized protein